MEKESWGRKQLTEAYQETAIKLEMMVAVECVHMHTHTHAHTHAHTPV